MSPTAIISLVKDGLIIAAVAAMIYLFISYGKDTVKIADMKAIQSQVVENAKTQERWFKEQTDADLKRDADLAGISTRIGKQSSPIILRQPGSCPMSPNSAKASSQPTSSGGANVGSGTNIRPQVNGYELKYEKALVDCRAALAKWPH